MKLIYGIGNAENIITSINNKRVLPYTYWKNMLTRCYSDKLHIRCPWYIGCSVCDEWKLYSNFIKWYDEHYIDGYQLDKDILIDGNKVYSPETCCFIPQKINVLLLNYNLVNRNTPIGVSFNKRLNKYESYIRLNDKKVHLGCYDDANDAHNIYIKYKKQYIIELADDYYINNKISANIRNALYKKANNLY